MTDDAGGWPGTRPALAASLEDEGLSADVVAMLMDAARPALMLAATRIDEDATPVGATKIGGRPDLPPGMTWPMRPPYANAAEMAKERLDASARFHAEAGVVPPWVTGSDGPSGDAVRRRAGGRPFLFTAEQAAGSARAALAKADAAAVAFPLSFLAQVDLAALAGEPGFDPALPRSGRLYLFYDLLLMPAPFDPRSAPGLRVVHDDAEPATLVRTDMPAALAAVRDIEDVALPPCRVATASVTTVPADVAGLTDDDRETYREWLAEVPGWPGSGRDGAYQLGGWPREIQDGMRETAQLAANGIGVDDRGSAEARRLRPGAGAWRLVFQLGEDEASGGLPTGALNILMREDDLAAGRFDRAWAVYEDS